jgi:dolichol-phosphate mannosyltransferase
MTDISVITPTRNEVGNVERLVSRVHGALKAHAYEHIIVDDDSPDGTADVARDLAVSYPVRVVVRNHERGLASAVIAGFSRAMGDALCVIDGDLQHPPETIPKMYEAMVDADHDLVIASRHVAGASIEGWPARRRIISRIARGLAHLALPEARGIRDPLSGFFLVRRRVIEGTDLNPIGYKVLLEVLVRCTYRSVIEYPYVFVEREVGDANLSAAEDINFVRHLWSLRRRHRETSGLRSESAVRPRESYSRNSDLAGRSASRSRLSRP